MEVTLKVNVCDICVEQGRPVAEELRPVERYTVRRGDADPVAKLVCGPHARSLDTFISGAPAPARKTAAASPRRRGIKKTTMAAITASKGH